MNLQEELKLLKERIAELEEQAKEEQEFPQNGDKYWFIGGDGEVYNAFYHNDDMDRDYRSMGNIFKTKEQAEFAAEKLKIEAELRKFSRPFKGDNKNYCIELRSPYTTVTLYAYKQYQSQGVIYFDSKEDAEKAIQSVGVERIKKYIFGVED